ncbi:hypothetical protein UlMin_012884 [Ulmus minor]
MSVSDKEISGNGSGGDDGDDDEDQSGGVHQRDDQTMKGRHSFSGFSRNFKKVGHVVLRPFSKARKKFFGKDRIKGSSSTNVGTSSSSKGKVIGDGVDIGCYFCFNQSRTLESSARSPISDPNDPAFTYEMMKVLLEKNDFYSKDSNTHFDSD